VHPRRPSAGDSSSDEFAVSPVKEVRRLRAESADVVQQPEDASIGWLSKPALSLTAVPVTAARGRSTTGTRSPVAEFQSPRSISPDKSRRQTNAGDSGDERIRFTGPILAVLCGDRNSARVTSEQVLQGVWESLSTMTGGRNAQILRCCDEDPENKRFLVALRNNKHVKSLTLEEGATVVIAEQKWPIAVLDENDRKLAIKFLRQIHKH
jgi:hypothetical protein